MNCGKQGHYIKNCRSQSATPPKHIKKFKGIESKEEFKGTQDCVVKYFTFYYNNVCQIHKEAKYSTSYQLKELKPDTFKGTEEKEDQICELDKDLMLMCSQRSAEIAIERLVSPFSGPKYNNLYGWDQETSSNKEIAKVDIFARRAKTAISRA